MMKTHRIVGLILILIWHQGIAAGRCKDRHCIPATATAAEGRVVNPGHNMNAAAAMRSPFSANKPIPHQRSIGVARDTQGLVTGPHQAMVPEKPKHKIYRFID